MLVKNLLEVLYAEDEYKITFTKDHIKTVTYRLDGNKFFEIKEKILHDYGNYQVNYLTYNYSNDEYVIVVKEKEFAYMT